MGAASSSSLPSGGMSTSKRNPVRASGLGLTGRAQPALKCPPRIRLLPAQGPGAGPVAEQRRAPALGPLTPYLLAAEGARGGGGGGQALSKMLLNAAGLLAAE